MLIMNTAFIDAQNLYLGTRSDGWEVDLARFRIYLRDKYKISVAYYYLGCKSSEHNRLYISIEDAGFILKFREHSLSMSGNKKGNVDADIVFEMMRHYIDETNLNLMILVSGDGDYKKVVDYLILKNKLLKILFPSKRYSSLYKPIGNKYTDILSRKDLRSLLDKNSQ